MMPVAGYTIFCRFRGRSEDDDLIAAAAVKFWGLIRDRALEDRDGFFQYLHRSAMTAMSGELKRISSEVFDFAGAACEPRSASLPTVRGVEARIHSEQMWEEAARLSVASIRFFGARGGRVGIS
jgi:hypothetical protein